MVDGLVEGVLPGRVVGDDPRPAGAVQADRDAGLAGDGAQLGHRLA